jgi:hypothetical protein
MRHHVHHLASRSIALWDVWHDVRPRNIDRYRRRLKGVDVNDADVPAKGEYMERQCNREWQSNDGHYQSRIRIHERHTIEPLTSVRTALLDCDPT